jgi:hypothetical protein
MKAYGQRHYTPDYDRGCELREIAATGETIHRYLDERPSLWRDRLGNIIQPQPGN